MRVLIVVPALNEESGLPPLLSELRAVAERDGFSAEIVVIDDASTDRTAEVAREHGARVVRLCRNLGIGGAVQTGLRLALREDFDCAVQMDGDGQHPPEMIAEMLRLYESGYDIVHTQRVDRGREGFFLKSLTSKGFYWAISRLGETRIEPGSADFRLMSLEAVNALRQLPEYHRFYRGMVHWIGFSSVILPFVPEDRIAGKSKYSLRKMIRLAGDGMFSFSLAPLRLGLVLGAVFLLLAGAELLYVLSFWLREDTSSLVPGWSSLIVVITVSSGFSMLLIGILGIYVGMIFQEVKRRPVYLIKGWTPDSEQVPHSIPQHISSGSASPDNRDPRE